MSVAAPGGASISSWGQVGGGDSPQRAGKSRAAVREVTGFVVHLVDVQVDGSFSFRRVRGKEVRIGRRPTGAAELLAALRTSC